MIERTSTFDEDEEPTLAFYTTSHSPAPGCESRNHWVRDACMREDKTRSRNYKLNCNLSALRVCLVALKAELHPEPSWPKLQERGQHNPCVPLQALLKHRSK